MSNSIIGVVEYYRRHGLKKTFSRAGLGIKRALFASRMVVFYCDLNTLKLTTVKIPTSLSVERVTGYTDLSPSDVKEMTGFWNPKQAHRNIEQRFENRASLWLVRAGDTLAGYGWTIQGRAIAEYYFPFGAADAQLFDFYVFPKYRGRALHWLLTVYILQTLAAEGYARAFADTGEWNQAQLASFKMTPFRRLGMVRSFSMFSRTFVSWVESEAIGSTQQVRKISQPEQAVTNAVRSHQ